MAKKKAARKHVEYTFKDGMKIGPQGVTATPEKVKESTSSNGMTKYLTILWTDGVLSCNCPGWSILKKNKVTNVPIARTCKHCKASEKIGNRDMSTVAAFKAAATTPVQSSQLTLGGRHARNINFTPRNDNV